MYIEHTTVKGAVHLKMYIFELFTQQRPSKVYTTLLSLMEIKNFSIASAMHKTQQTSFKIYI